MKKNLARFASMCIAILSLSLLNRWGLTWLQLVVVWLTLGAVYVLASIENRQP